MPATTPPKPKVFVDADVLFAGAAAGSQHSASLVVMRMAEITLIEAFTSQQVIDECERNLSAKIPVALPAFRLLVSRSLQIVPAPAAADLAEYTKIADPKDLPILVAALQTNCTWLVTFNLRHFQPGHPGITVLRPGDFVLRVRELLTYLP
jgi:predicted nucleic acid-binding protein